MTAAKRPLAVLFDLDGTLVDSVALLLACMNHTFEGRDPRPTEDEWIAPQYRLGLPGLAEAALEGLGVAEREALARQVGAS